MLEEKEKNTVEFKIFKVEENFLKKLYLDELMTNIKGFMVAWS